MTRLPAPASARPRALAPWATALALAAAAPSALAGLVFSEDFAGAVGISSGFPYGDGYGLGMDIVGTQFRVTAGTVDVVGLPSGAPWACGWSAAGNCLDLVGANYDGSIESKPSFDLVAGTTYTIRFGASSGVADSSFLVTLGAFSSLQVATGQQGSYELIYTPGADETGVRLAFATVTHADAFHGAVLDNITITSSQTGTPIPEPGSAALALVGLAALAWRGRGAAAAR